MLKTVFMVLLLWQSHYKS